MSGEVEDMERKLRAGLISQDTFDRYLKCLAEVTVERQPEVVKP